MSCRTRRYTTFNSPLLKDFRFGLGSFSWLMNLDNFLDWLVCKKQDRKICQFHRGDVFKCLVLFVQQSKAQNKSGYCDIKQTKAANPHTVSSL